MKKKLCLLLALFFIGFSCGCSQEGKIAKNTKNLFTIYNAALDITVSLGESKASLEEKFNADQYTRRESESLDGEALAYYEIRTGDRMALIVHLLKGKVTLLHLTPFIADDAEGTPDEQMLEAWRNAESDWYFKGGITARSPKEEVYRILGNPSDEIETEHPALGKTTSSTYSFTENQETVPPGNYELKAVTGMSLQLINDEIYNLSIGFLL